jgi:hypothetical protein
MNLTKDMTYKAAKVWHYKDAPQPYQALYDPCGDEDWLIFLPNDHPDKDHKVPDIVDRLSKWGHWETDVEGGTIYVTSM